MNSENSYDIEYRTQWRKEVDFLKKVACSIDTRMLFICQKKPKRNINI